MSHLAAERRVIEVEMAATGVEAARLAELGIQVDRDAVLSKATCFEAGSGPPSMAYSQHSDGGSKSSRTASTAAHPS